jgi:hypothetical protein
MSGQQLIDGLKETILRLWNRRQSRKLLRSQLADRENLIRAASLLLSVRDQQIANLQYALSDAQQALYRFADKTEPEPAIKMSNQPLYLSEDQEDIQWQYDQDLINLKQYQALMKELDFQNSEVQFDEEPVENFHY